MITLNKQPGQKVLELGGGSNPNPATDVNVDCRMMPGVNFTCDFNGPLPINDAEFDHVFSHFLLEHVSWRNVPALLKEIYRVMKPGGMTLHAVPNTASQINWLLDHRSGWDGKGSFDSASGMFFGDQDYPENCHRCYFDPDVIRSLFANAGFTDVDVKPYGARNTDMLVSATKPGIVRVVKDGKLIAQELHLPETDTMTALTVSTYGQEEPGAGLVIEGKEEVVVKGQTSATGTREELGLPGGPKAEPPKYTREQMFDKHYFNGGAKVGGYAREGYWDYPVHEITTKHILARKPESVLELGCARAYVLKRLQDAGVPGAGLEISKHCFMTRVCDPVYLTDLCKTTWPIGPLRDDILARGTKFHDVDRYDLCYSVATLEHVPEEHLAAVIKEMARTCKRGLHGVDFGEKDDSWDKTHVTLRSKIWWDKIFATVAPGWPAEIVDKEELERGEFPPEVAAGDGRIKLNVGSHISMLHHGWTNIDVGDLANWAAQFQYKYLRHDVRNGLPFSTGVVDCIMACHFLEHLNYSDGAKFLRECRRVLRPDGGLRIIVPDAALLMTRYHNHLCDITGNHSDFGRDTLDEFDEINDGCQDARTAAGKLWALLHEGHMAAYDAETLKLTLEEAGFTALPSMFRGDAPTPALQQIKREAFDTFPCLSLFMSAIPDVG